MGAPQLIYNGGLLMARVRYYDAERQRPGLPPDVAALVERIDVQDVRLRLVNTSPFEARSLIVQAGAFAEHTITTATYDVRTSVYPGPSRAYCWPRLETSSRRCAVGSPHMQVDLPPATEITLDLELGLHSAPPSYSAPW